MKENDIETVNEEMELQEREELLRDVTVTEPKNIQFEIPEEENQHYDSLSEVEKARWRKMFNNLDKIDSKKDDSVCISYVVLLIRTFVGYKVSVSRALANVLDKLEDRNNLFFFRRQTTRKINRLDNKIKFAQVIELTFRLQ